MTLPDEVKTDAPRRPRGRPLRINRSQIIDVAKTMDPQTMTMQAIADELGVDRSAINYHVTNREGLRRLIATDVFESSFKEAFDGCLDTAETASPGDWRNSVRAWAVAVRDGLVATGDVTNYYRISGENAAIFEPVEFVLQRLLSAGFDITTAGRVLVLVTRFAMGIGRDIVMEKQLGEHPQGPEVRRLLPDVDQEHYQAFRWLIAAELNGPDDIGTQFEFELRIFLDGLERRLDDGGATHRS